MSFLVNPFIYAGAAAFPNTYSMQFIATATVANIEKLYINNQSNAIDTALRDTTPNFSVSFWFKQDTASSGTTRAIFSKYDDYAGWDRCILIYLDTTGKLVTYGNYDQNNSSVNLQTQAIFTGSSWNHYTFVYDSTQTTASAIAKVYLNGVEYTNWSFQSVNTTNKRFFNQTVQSQRAWVTAACRYQGASARLNTTAFGGLIDDLTFWDKSLSQSEAEELYNSGEPKDVSTMTSYSSNCLAWYRMGDATGDTFSTNWTIQNVKGTASTDMTSQNLVLADRVTDVY